MFRGGKGLVLLIVDQEVSAEKDRNPVQPAFHGRSVQRERENVFGIFDIIQPDLPDPSGRDKGILRDSVVHDDVYAFRRLVRVAVPLSADQLNTGLELSPALFYDFLIISGVGLMRINRISQGGSFLCAAGGCRKKHKQQQNGCQEFFHRFRLLLPKERLSGCA